MASHLDELDLATLPDYAFGAASPSWWAVFGLMLIEGAAFLLAIGAYLYLMPFETQWPPAPHPPPGWPVGVALLVVLLSSELANVWTKRAGHAMDLARVRAGLAVMVGAGLLAIGLRAFEFLDLNVHWTDNAYGSIVWAILVLHTAHLVTDVYDTVVLLAVSWRKKMTGRKFADVVDNGMYWHFIVWSWVVLFVLLYAVPRWR